VYLHVDAEPKLPPAQEAKASLPSDEFRIVRAEVKGNKRVLGDIKRQITGKVSQEQRFVKTTVTPLKGGWLKITPTEPLASGEYALVEMMGNEGMNLYVWDFGVNAKAAANANPWKPDARKETPQTKPDTQSQRAPSQN
jgi:hypothetical protein